ncbi:sialate O-acetylesterase-like [Mizuhopecten yessoensis]|uniref:Sialate O-acetylesterase n=1 Tax=Mizuhopecten yessoensis TaxID=6573 RepID=A0A210PY92_MIZYE|nr:sialate O-acetylesterase-like [Mizuhopecten yessoensis]OWF41444.1 Sialate O-acetylesterase [Mizuhopecten yessoensis]
MTLVLQIAFVLCILADNASSEPGKLSFASYYGDHMVLQRAPQRAVVWGYASLPVGSVNVTVKGAGSTIGVNYTSRVSPHPETGGVWSVTLRPVNDTKPYTLTLAGRAGTEKISDVLFGDVWLCSGQSNMQFTVNMSYNASVQLEDVANYTSVRVFTAQEATSRVALRDLKAVLEPWSIPSKASLEGREFTYFSDLCWLYGRYLHDHLMYPIGLIDTTWGETAIEQWTSSAVLKKCNVTPKPLHDSELWNAMISPFASMSLYGVIWYQGESNAPEPSTYNCTFPGMIEDWRKHFSSNSDTRPEFPFGFVQLGPNHNDSSITAGFPDIRWHQTADVGYVPNTLMPNTFMAVAMDLPDFKSPWDSIHPRDKDTVARRLVMAAMSVAYNLTMGEIQGPFPESFQVDSAYMTLYVRYTNTVLAPIRSNHGFEVICSPFGKYVRSNHVHDDATWSSVPIIQSDNTAITLDLQQACANQTVAGVRYAWRESPCEYKSCAIYSQYTDLPAPPYLVVGYLP